jgi:hypothetical protein
VAVALPVQEYKYDECPKKGYIEGPDAVVVSVNIAK